MAQCRAQRRIPPAAIDAGFYARMGACLIGTVKSESVPGRVLPRYCLEV
jgi:hypothetical protein